MYWYSASAQKHTHEHAHARSRHTHVQKHAHTQTLTQTLHNLTYTKSHVKLTRCMRTKGLGPRHVSQTIGMSDLSQPSDWGSLKSLCAIFLFHFQNKEHERDERVKDENGHNNDTEGEEDDCGSMYSSSTGAFIFGFTVLISNIFV